MLKVYCKEPQFCPTRAHRKDAGMDLVAAEDTILLPNKTTLVPCGIHLEITRYYVGLIFSRSGLATNEGIALINGVGVIDSTYRGEVKVGLTYNPATSRPSRQILKYERIAQLVIVPVWQEELTEIFNISDLNPSDRGSQGFGSTGS